MAHSSAMFSCRSGLSKFIDLRSAYMVHGSRERAFFPSRLPAVLSLPPMAQSYPHYSGLVELSYNVPGSIPGPGGR